MTDTADTSDWPSRARALAGYLAESGVLTDPKWRAAVEQTPRHVFVPSFFDDDRALVDGADPAHTQRWLERVYRDESLVVQRIAVPGADQDWPTSSATMPSLMVRMLELLEVSDRSRVLEIGTATGYNAALMCHRLGDGQVASIELHPGLAADAADRLRELGYRPRLAVGDGAAGIVAGAPYDRILATCAVPAVPTTWIDQLADGGRIVADLRSELSSSLVVFDKIDRDTVQGRMLEQPGHFMWLRPDPNNPLLDGGRWDLVLDVDGAETARTDLDPAVLEEPGLRVLLGIREPTLEPPTRVQRGDTRYVKLRAAGGAWADLTIDEQGATVAQGGPRRLWPAVEYAVAEWRRLGQPGRGRYGLTVTRDGVHRYWLDRPEHTIQFVNVVAARPELAEELLKRGDVDQQVRAFAFEGRGATDVELERARQVDEDNTAWLEKIVAEHGWPGVRLVGERGSHAAWLLAQHADRNPDLQRHWLTLLEAAVEAGDAERSNVAYLQDRVAVHERRPQRHGTQFLRADGRDGLAPLADPDQVNAFRESAGLHPLTAEQIVSAHTTYPTS